MSETAQVPADTPQVLLEHHLKALRLPTFLREYDKVARQCAAEDVDYPRYLLRMSELELLDRERLLPAGEINFLDTPRRLAVLASNIPAAQPDLTEQVPGPAVTVAFKDGQPSADPVPFMTGLVPDPSSGNVYGRPVGVAVAPDGSLLVSDDGAALIYRISVDR